MRGADVLAESRELLAIAPPAWRQGRSILPVIRGDAALIRDELFGEVTYHAAYEPQRGIRTTRWKYIRRFDGRPRAVLPNIDPGPSKTAWLAQGGATQPRPQEMLFDLAADPDETSNLVDAPAARLVLADLHGRLEAWMQETGDPLLRGPVPPPPGAVVTDPDGIDP